MVYTFQYTNSHTCTGEYANIWDDNYVQPLPGYNPTVFTISLDAPPPEMFTAALQIYSGTDAGGDLLSCNVQPGTTSCSYRANVTIPQGATAVRIVYFIQNLTVVPVTLNSTVTVTYQDAVAPGACQYGTEPAPTAPLVTFITDAAVTAACTLFGAPWLSVLFDPLIGYAIDTGVLCGTGPPPINTITPQTLLDSIEDKLTILQNVMWYSVCQCTPAPSGESPPVPYSPPTITQPTGWPTRPNYTCTDTDVCATLLLILKRLDELNTSQQVNITQTTTVVGHQAPLAYTIGLTHDGLTGSGSFSVANLIGVRIELTPVGDPAQLQGNPPYLLDQGWMSVSDGGALLIERRLARSEQEWFPPEMTLATVVGYFANQGATLRITELLPVS